MRGRGPGDDCSGSTSTLEDAKHKREHLHQLLLCCWTNMETACSDPGSTRQTILGARHPLLWQKQPVAVRLPPEMQMPQPP
jgi:hypothetical protein